MGGHVGRKPSVQSQKLGVSKCCSCSRYSVGCISTPADKMQCDARYDDLNRKAGGRDCIRDMDVNRDGGFCP